jgi:hypothetical protein
MSFNHPKAGPNYVPAYQISGIPFVTSSIDHEVPGPDSDSLSTPVSVSFPFVTKFITVRNTGPNELRVGFSADGVIAPGERRATVNADKLVTGPGSTRNFFLIPTASVSQGGSDIQTFDIRCKQIFFLSNVEPASDPTTLGKSTSFSLLAGLTGIQASQFPVLTGSNGFEGVG